MPQMLSSFGDNPQYECTHVCCIGSCLISCELLLHRSSAEPMENKTQETKNAVQFDLNLNSTTIPTVWFEMEPSNLTQEQTEAIVHAQHCPPDHETNLKAQSMPIQPSSTGRKSLCPVFKKLLWRTQQKNLSWPPESEPIQRVLGADHFLNQQHIDLYGTVIASVCPGWLPHNWGLAEPLPWTYSEPGSGQRSTATPHTPSAKQWAVDGYPLTPKPLYHIVRSELLCQSFLCLALLYWT